MNTQIAALARQYYEAMSQRNAPAIEALLHDSVRFLSPVTEVKGKKAVFEWVKSFLPSFKRLDIRSVLSNESQSVVVYDVVFEEHGVFRSAALLDFEDGLVVSIELFFDLSKMKR